MEKRFGDVVLIDPVKDKRWDRFVEEHPFGWLCHLSGWRNVLENSFKHIKGYYLTIQHQENIKAALPIFEVKSWLIGNRLISIPFATLCDPLVSSADEMKTLMKSGKKLAEELGVSYVEVRTLASSLLVNNSSVGIDDNYKQHYIELNQSPDDLRKTFDRTCVRQRINRAEKSNLNIKTGENEADLKSFYKLYFMTRKNIGLPPQPYKFIKAIWEEFYPSKNISLLLAEHNKQPIAALMLFKYKNRVSAEYSATDNEYRNYSPNHLLFWEAIKSAYKEGYEIFDFGRTSKNNISLMDFKKRWGTKLIDIPIVYYPKEALIKNGERESSRKYKIINKICRNVPDSALTMIGNFIYRHN